MENDNQPDVTRKLRATIAPSGIMSRESWKIFQIMAEFVTGFERLAQIQPSVSIFGSARIPPNHPYYALTEEIARKLSDAPAPCIQWQKLRHFKFNGSFRGMRTTAARHPNSSRYLLDKNRGPHVD